MTPSRSLASEANIIGKEILHQPEVLLEDDRLKPEILFPGLHSLRKSWVMDLMQFTCARLRTEQDLLLNALLDQPGGKPFRAWMRQTASGRTIYPWEAAHSQPAPPTRNVSVGGSRPAGKLRGIIPNLNPSPAMLRDIRLFSQDRIRMLSPVPLTHFDDFPPDLQLIWEFFFLLAELFTHPDSPMVRTWTFSLRMPSEQGTIRESPHVQKIMIEDPRPRPLIELYILLKGRKNFSMTNRLRFLNSLLRQTAMPLVYGPDGGVSLLPPKLTVGQSLHALFRGETEPMTCEDIRNKLRKFRHQHNLPDTCFPRELLSGPRTLSNALRQQLAQTGEPRLYPLGPALIGCGDMIHSLIPERSLAAIRECCLKKMTHTAHSTNISDLLDALDEALPEDLMSPLQNSPYRLDGVLLSDPQRRFQPGEKKRYIQLAPRFRRPSRSPPREISDTPDPVTHVPFDPIQQPYRQGSLTAAVFAKLCEQPMNLAEITEYFQKKGENPDTVASAFYLVVSPRPENDKGRGSNRDPRGHYSAKGHLYYALRSGNRRFQIFQRIPPLPPKKR